MSCLHHAICADIGEAARLRDKVSSADAQMKQMHADLEAWEEAVSLRDTELRNLQVSVSARLLCRRITCFHAVISTSSSSPVLKVSNISSIDLCNLLCPSAL